VCADHSQVIAGDDFNLELGCQIFPNRNGVGREVRVALRSHKFYFAWIKLGAIVSHRFEVTVSIARRGAGE
jgi:hypothetical protein